MKLIKLASCVAAATFLTACGSDSDSSSSTSRIQLDKVQQVVNTNADIAYAAYSDSVATAKALQTALAALKENPTAENLIAAKKAWLVAREPYGQTEVYRFRNSPIDSTDYESEDGPEGDINAWPLGEALIDYVTVTDLDANASATNYGDFDTAQVGVTSHDTGVNGNNAITVATVEAARNENIIGNINVNISSDLLANNATAQDEHDVISGYHAIEFLLWGQDLKGGTNPGEITNKSDRDDAVNATQQGGSRGIEDFQPGYDGTTVTYDSTELSHRRHKYLEVAVEKLIADLEQVQAGWAPNVADNYRAQFTTIETEAQAKQKLTEILTGMGTLSEGELAGERMKIALNNNSQEDEHSCFSDNTHRDIWLNAEGVSNSYYGEYAGYDSSLNAADDVTTNAVDGYGIYDYLKDVGLENLAEDVKTAMSDTETKYTSIDTKARDAENPQPFDVLIYTKDDSVKQTIKALNTQANAIQVIANELSLGDVVDEDASACDTSTAEPVDGEEC